MKYQPQVITPSKPRIFPSDVDYAEDYAEELADIFCYDVYAEGNEYVIKIRFDHLKHHNAAAFPAALLLKEKPEKIQYTITSKNSMDVIYGQISVEE